MPVIGRLDGQVDEVLIAPLEKRRRGDAPQNPDDAEQPAARDEVGKSAARDEPQRDAARGRSAGKDAGNELPVWLL